MRSAMAIVTRLTPRELEVLLALWRHPHYSAAKLARTLCVTEACVRYHLHNIYRKLGTYGKVGLLLLCKDSGFDAVAEAMPPLP